ncbi:MAG: type II toxin-antitoxin system HicA family toxin [Gemmatimonadaceae bacterium]
MHSREIIAALQDDGWQLDRVQGSHHQFRHPTKRGTVTDKHPARHTPSGTLRSIERQSGLTLRRG